jgi:hypothetical protein
MQSVMETPLGLDPLVDISTTGELTEQLKRGLAGLEFLADQIKQRVVADEAMAPQIARGDWVVISPAAELKPGNVVAINDRNQMQLRRYMAADDIVSLLPLNPDYAAKSLLTYKSKDKVEIVGRVLRVVNRAL